MEKTEHFTKHVFKNETLNVRKVKKKKILPFLCV